MRWSGGRDPRDYDPVRCDKCEGDERMCSWCDERPDNCKCEMPAPGGLGDDVDEAQEYADRIEDCEKCGGSGEVDRQDIEDPR